MSEKYFSNSDLPIRERSPDLTLDNSTSTSQSVTWTIPLQITVTIGVPTRGPDSVRQVTSQKTGNARNVERDEALADLDRAATRLYFDEVANQSERDLYYAQIDAGASPDAFYRALRELLKSTHTSTPSYKPAKRLYPWVDLRPDLSIRSIYSGKGFDPRELIELDFAVDQRREEGLARIATESTDPGELERLVAQLEATLPYNCEHVVPQSWFQKREPMRGDLHHLFACEVKCNSFRSNTPYFDFDDFAEAIRTDCGKSEPDGFEPKLGKGTVARATLYFLLRYPGEIKSRSSGFSSERIATLLKWHTSEAPDSYELHRNRAIFESQGNRNPLIDHPEWADRIAFKLGLG